jgi:hypothetical protein
MATLYFNNTKEKSSIVIEKRGFVGCFYQDTSLGRPVGVFELFNKDSVSVIHSTMERKADRKRIESIMDYYLKFLENY